jgi:hypothetical protein
VEVLTDVDEERIRSPLGAVTHVRVDLTAPGGDAPATLDAHPLALEDSQELNQRPKIDRYARSTLVVYHGAGAGRGGRQADDVYSTRAASAASGLGRLTLVSALPRPAHARHGLLRHGPSPE